MKKWKQWLVLSGAVLPAALLAQTNHNHSAGCSVGLSDGALIKQRMLENRRTVPAHAIEAFQTQRVPTYIPVVVTSVANTSGVGHVDPNDVYDMICDLNRDYADQNVMFYLKEDSIRFRQNNNMYNNAGSGNSAIYMSSNKAANALNIYISQTVQNQAASFYSPIGDYIFIITSEADGSSNTATHEVGHFFSLAHTFYGWEGIDVAATYGTNNTPTMVGGERVEYKTRSGSTANCQTAADGFCDTDADYYSDRTPCPFTAQAKDPGGTTITPDVTLYMSYFYDNCVNRFSTEQKAAISADLISRGWQNLAAPNPSTQVTAAGATATYPINSQLVTANGTNDITLTWNPIAGATWYQVTLQRTLAGSPLSTIFQVEVRNGTSYTFNSSQMPLPPVSGSHEYTWTIRPMNKYWTCATPSDGFVFRATQSPVGVEELNASSLGMDFAIAPNPSSLSQVSLRARCEREQLATIQIYGMDGRLCTNALNQALTAGENTLLLDISNLSNGLYMVVMTTERGSIQRKLVVERP